MKTTVLEQYLKLPLMEAPLWLFDLLVSFILFPPYLCMGAPTPSLINTHLEEPAPLEITLFLQLLFTQLTKKVKKWRKTFILPTFTLLAQYPESARCKRWCQFWAALLICPTVSRSK